MDAEEQLYLNTFKALSGKTIDHAYPLGDSWMEGRHESMMIVFTDGAHLELGGDDYLRVKLVYPSIK